MKRQAFRFSLLALATAVATSAAVVTACSDDDDDATGGIGTINPDSGQTTPTDSGVGEATTQPTDGGVAGDQGVVAVLMAVNKGEIDQATLAQTKAANTEVKWFADMMISDHTAANQRASALVQSLGLSAQDNDVSNAVKTEGETALAQLQPLSGAAFDKAYIDAQVLAHTHALTIIDTNLIPAATSTAMKDELTTVRTSVAGHLQHAQMIQTALQDGGTDASTD